MDICIIDTSAVVAIYALEPDALLFRDVLRTASQRILPVCCLVEFCALQRLGGARDVWIREFMDDPSVSIPPMTREIAFLAADAALRYGRGTGQRAHLNFGDCMSYAHAIHFRAPLLFKGDDFTFTDVEVALQQ